MRTLFLSSRMVFSRRDVLPAPGAPIRFTTNTPASLNRFLFSSASLSLASRIRVTTLTFINSLHQSWRYIVILVLHIHFHDLHFIAFLYLKGGRTATGATEHIRLFNLKLSIACNAHPPKGDTVDDEFCVLRRCPHLCHV